MKAFDLYAERYDRWYELPFGSSAFRLELECLRRLRRGGLSLEVGVGSGRFASALGIEYGVDTSKELLKLAVRRGVRVFLARAESLPFKEKAFEQVFMIVSVCFFQDPTKAFEEAYRVLNEKGSLVLGLVLAESPWAVFYKRKAEEGHPLYSLANFYSLYEIQRMLRASGFEQGRILSTLFDPPQDKEPIKSTRIEEGFSPEGGFFCIEGLRA